MNILHVIASLAPAGGGPPIMVIRLTAALARMGHQVHLLSYATPGTKGPAIDPGVRLPSTLRLYLLPPPTYFERVLVRSARRELARLVEHMDMVHLHGVWEPLLLAAAGEARRHGVRYVYSPHGMLDPWSLRQKRWKKWLALALGYRRALSRAAFLHVLNADEEHLLKPLRLTCPTRIIPNGVSLEELEPLPPAGSYYAQHPELGGQPFVLFLSRLHYKKGLDYLADAFVLLAGWRPDVRLVVAGPDGGARADFEGRMKQAGLADRVHVVGALYGADKFAALADASAFCLPSRQEGFSIAILEALACGVPVVISENCHFPEVGEAGAGEVVPLDAQRVADALFRVLDQKPLRQRMGQAGRELVRSRYTWARVAEQCVGAYQEALVAPAAGLGRGYVPVV